MAIDILDNILYYNNNILYNKLIAYLRFLTNTYHSHTYTFATISIQRGGISSILVILHSGVKRHYFYKSCSYKLMNFKITALNINIHSNCSQICNKKYVFDII